MGGKIVLQAHSNGQKELVHIYAATPILVEEMKEFFSFLFIQFHSCVVHPFCEFLQIQRFVPVIVHSSKYPEMRKQLSTECHDEFPAFKRKVIKYHLLPKI